MIGIIALVTEVLGTVIPKLIDLGEDVVPLVLQTRKAIDDIGTQVSPDDPAFVELKAKQAEIEGNFDAAVAERLKELGA